MGWAGGQLDSPQSGLCTFLIIHTSVLPMLGSDTTETAIEASHQPDPYN